MLVLSIICFVAAALSGVFLGAVRFKKDANPPMGAALVHGVLAAAGLVLVWEHAIGHAFPGVMTLSAALFLVAALGGFLLFFLHLKDRLIPAGVVMVHAVAAVAGFVLLLVGAVQ